MKKKSENIGPKIYIFTFGCASRYLDGEKFKNFFIQNNYEITNKIEDADFILLNTCAFRKKEEDIAIERLIEFGKRKKKNAEVIVAGCLPAINKERMDKVFKGKNFSPKELSKINDFFEHNIKIEDIPDVNSYKFHRPKSFIEVIKTLPKVNKTALLKRTFQYAKAKILQNIIADEVDKQFFIRIANGCLGNCSYCAIKFGIGNLKSKPFDKIKTEIETLLKKNGKICITLTGDDTAAYGGDINTSFAELLNRIIEYPNIKKIDIEEINIQWLVKDYERLKSILVNPKFNRLWLALQSGSEKILKSMNRPILEIPKNTAIKLASLKKAAPNLIYRGQFIVGFPGETLEDMELTLNHIIDSKFDEVNLFKFDAKPNTKAKSMTDQISDKEKNRRIKHMSLKLKKHKIKILTNN